MGTYPTPPFAPPYNNDLGIDIPKDKDYPPTAGQCGICGGNGCEECDQRGWFWPWDHPLVRKCFHKSCKNAIPPARISIYCSNDCASFDTYPYYHDNAYSNGEAD